MTTGTPTTFTPSARAAAVQGVAWGDWIAYPAGNEAGAWTVAYLPTKAWTGRHMSRAVAETWARVLAERVPAIEYESDERGRRRLTAPIRDAIDCAWTEALRSRPTAEARVYRVVVERVARVEVALLATSRAAAESAARRNRDELLDLLSDAATESVEVDDDDCAGLVLDDADVGARDDSDYDARVFHTDGQHLYECDRESLHAPTAPTSLFVRLTAGDHPLSCHAAMRDPHGDGEPGPCTCPARHLPGPPPNPSPAAGAASPCASAAGASSGVDQ